jgi:hypothetical protein
MGSLSGDLDELRRQLNEGSIQRAYVAILTYMQGLRAHFAEAHGDRSVSGMYQGYFDMTYFALFPASLKSRDLKLAIVFDYESFRFEVWLAARNRRVQRQYWELLRNAGWSEYRLIEPAPGIDAIVAYELEGGFDLDEPDTLTARIDNAAAELLAAVEDFLTVHDSR